jgi:membrane protein DedA with SNARE-associated domain
VLPHIALLDSPTGLAASIFLLAFAYEDGATLLAATLTMAGRLDARLGFASSFLGIWVGDLGLYFAGSSLGARVAQFPWTQRFVSGETFTKSQVWFTHRGIFAIVLSRFVPGSRLPLYLAAGALKHPARAFASVTAICSIIWITAIFVAARYAAFARLSFGKSFAVFTAALLLAPWMGTKLLRSVFPKARALLRKYSRWEFWPPWMFYPPVIAICAWLSIKYRGLALPAIANPSFRNGGIVGESKIEILRMLMGAAPEYVADGYLLPAAKLQERVESFRRVRERHALPYPLVLKPNVGQRGAGFKIVHSDAQAQAYLARVKSEVMVQRYVADEKEVGVFYYRMPSRSRGEIFAVTQKVFPFVTGDGVSTFQELLHNDERASLIANTYLRRFPELRGKVLDAGEQLRLVEAGNHCQGCIFRDGGHLLSEALRERIDQISKAIPGFFIGRYDIRYSSDDDLLRGENFTILELNGAASEATNIYDERNSLLSAYRTLYQQWDLVYRIGRANRDRGHKPASVLAVLRDARLYAQMAQSYPAAD